MGMREEREGSELTWYLITARELTCSPGMTGYESEVEAVAVAAANYKVREMILQFYYGS